VLTTANEVVLSSDALVGAVLEITDTTGSAQTVRIDAVATAADAPAVLLHSFSVLDEHTGGWRPMCEPDAKGRRVGFPVAGAWGPKGEFIKDPSRWFVTCTSGSQGKCILWGYDPWGSGPGGKDLSAHYQACQFMTRADYRGVGAPFTRDGTTIDMWDAAGMQISDTEADPSFAFEAGWGPRGAVCVAHTRIPQLLPLQVLYDSAPRLQAAPCDEAEARRRGAVLFNRSR
jgi:hypothetical protein